MKSKRINLRRLLLALSALIILVVIATDSRFVVQDYTIESDKVSAEVKIALITDLHSCIHGENQSALISAIDDEAPDVILFGGDICDDEIPHDGTKLLLDGIAARYPCYYVTGNHEYWTRDVEPVLDIFRSYNVTVLEGSFETLEVNGQSINICGVSDPDILSYTDSDFGIYKQLNALTDVHENGNFTLLLAHRPELIDAYREHSFDLIMAGHAHGGQFRIPFLLNGLFAPNQGFFPEYAGGRYDFEDTTFIVSRGLATTSTKMPRVFNRPELVMITVK